jgi:hypothetical protein
LTTLSGQDYIASRYMMASELPKKEAFVEWHLLVGMRDNIKRFGQDSRSPGPYK